MTVPINPLGPEDCKCLNDALQSSAETEQYLRDLIACGVDCQPLLDEALSNRRKAEAIKKKFFPNAP